MLLRASRVSGLLIKEGLLGKLVGTMAGKLAKGAVKNWKPVLGVGAVAGGTGLAVAGGMEAAKRGHTRQALIYNRNRPVPPPPPIQYGGWQGYR